ncbi:hypothetical protein [Psychroserpens sp. NJDZ02]|uniref:hypothetical protein n=1 Tax=Psychroserpens sp. NJDZ02 TaxID=2570561 RepID=UPI0010A7BA64|nr:hypothetical protein [Psychroserpens sp. NJDZ02]QCE41696.1 hypothetical protein E9099_09805 [Psychroserpens sp. NJDZ02]
MIIVSKYLVPKGYTGMTVFPFIFLKSKGLKQHKTLINHEKIHLRQQLEMLILPFYVWYGMEFLINLIKHKNGFLAYKNISFEREAYCNDANLDYLKSRPFMRFLKYLSKHEI